MALRRSLSLPLLAILAAAAVVLPSAEAGIRGARSARPRRTAEAAPRDAAQRQEPRAERSPWKMPWSAWKTVFVNTYGEFNRDRVMAVAGGAVFYVILAMFPTITALVSLYAFIADASTISEHLSILAGIMPAEAFGLIRDEIVRIAAKPAAALGFASIAALLFALWSSNAGMKATFDALNVAYGEEEKRSFIRLNAVSLGFTVAALGFLLAALGGVVVVPLLFEAFGVGELGTWLLALLRWPALVLLIAGGLAVLYRYGPSRGRDVPWHWVTPGSLAATILFLAVSLLFSWYLANFADYTATYGSLGAAIGLMMWLWLTYVAVLAGAELDSEVERQLDPERERKKAEKGPPDEGEAKA